MGHVCSMYVCNKLLELDWMVNYGKTYSSNGKYASLN